MHESKDDLIQLQQLLDESRQMAGDHISKVFNDQSALSAEALVAELSGIFEMHLACLTAEGAPMVAPVDATLFRGSVWFGLPPAALRTRLVRLDNRVSVSYTRGSFALIVHGIAEEVATTDEIYKLYSAHIRDLYSDMHGPEWLKWYEQNRSDIERGYFGVIRARRMFVKR